MNNHQKHFNTFVEKVVIHNSLVPEKKLEQAKIFIMNKPELSLLHVLVKANLVTEKHSDLINKKFEEYSQKSRIPTQPYTDSHSASPGEPSASQTEQAIEHVAKTMTEKPDIENPVESLSADQPEIEDFLESGQLQNEMGHLGDISSDKSQQKKESSQTLEKYLISAKECGASDLHICVHSPPMIRKNGELSCLRHEVLNVEDTERLLFQVLNEEQKQRLISNNVLETCLSIDKNRYRCCFVRQLSGWDGSFRIINDTIPRFEELGLPDDLKQLADYREGLILITGPSGSGKSTTLASFIDLINRKRKEHIITLEDPVEYIFNPDLSHISQREVGLHTESFSMALRAALREDPDVIVVGELRDRETTSLAVSAAETGHLVFGTLHTTSAAQTIYRVLDFFPPEQRNQIRTTISESIRGVICQRLIPRKDGEGMALALEVLFNISAIANLIKEDRIYQLTNMIQINNKNGMKVLNESITQLLHAEIISGQNAYFSAENKERFKRWAPQLEAN